MCGVRCLYFSVASEAELIDDSGDRMYLVHAHAHGNDLLEREYHGRIPCRLRVREQTTVDDTLSRAVSRVGSGTVHV